MSVTVTIKTPTCSIERTGNTGFDEATRIARVLARLIEYLELIIPHSSHRGQLLGDMVIEELGGSLHPPLEPAPVATEESACQVEPAAVDPLKVIATSDGREKRWSMGETTLARVEVVKQALANGPMHYAALLRRTGLRDYQLRPTLAKGPFVNPQYGWWALAETAREEPAA